MRFVGNLMRFIVNFSIINSYSYQHFCNSFFKKTSITFPDTSYFPKGKSLIFYIVRKQHSSFVEVQVCEGIPCTKMEYK